MIPPPELSIIVPAYNEETRLPRTLTRIREYFASRGMGSEQLEILIVDDGSEDGTVQVAEKWAREWPSVRVVSNGDNRGKGYSV
ncbi:MAG: glycosyltransferase family 2 protein, partial [Candidatus Acidiferrales bacterium]